MSISINIENSIKEKLSSIQQTENIEILLAVESGSRAWGFESVDSDYDIRFIYKKDLSYYLSIDEKRDVIELPLEDNLDISGWDIKKTLKLFAKSNPPLLEWINSPIVYVKNENFYSGIRKLIDEYFEPKKVIYQYLHMAKGNFKDYLRSEQVPLKKYFYVMRTLLACKWIEENNTFPPVPFNILIDILDNDKIRDELFSLVEKKKNSIESGKIKRSDSLNKFIENYIEYYENYAKEISNNSNLNIENLNNFFRENIL